MICTPSLDLGLALKHVAAHLGSIRGWNSPLMDPLFRSGDETEGPSIMIS